MAYKISNISTKHECNVISNILNPKNAQNLKTLITNQYCRYILATILEGNVLETFKLYCTAAALQQLLWLI